MTKDHIAVALDVTGLDEAKRFAEAVAPHVGVLKIGLELFVAEGPRVVEALSGLGCKIFLDLKLHDIPETVRRAVTRAKQLGVRYLTVHAAGGRAMLAAAVDAAGDDVDLLAVTVLTSMGDGDLPWIGVTRSLPEQALALARMATDLKVRGLVCSPHEVSNLRRHFPSTILVTPGIRPDGKRGAAGDDQTRIATPSAAIESGSSMLVVGRPLRDAADRPAAARDLFEEVAGALMRLNGS